MLEIFTPGHASKAFMMPNIKTVKVVLLGQSGVGKSSIFLRLLRNQFQADHMSTLGAAYAVLYMEEHKDGELSFISESELRYRKGASKVWRIEGWDTAGQERYRSLLPMYYRRADVALVVHDGSKDSQLSARRTISEMRNMGMGPTFVICVMQNKSDLPETQHDETFARDCKAEEYGFVSAKSGEGVKELVLDACRRHIDLLTALNDDPKREDPDSITLQGEESYQWPCCGGYLKLPLP